MKEKSRNFCSETKNRSTIHQSNTDIQDAGTAGNLGSEGKLGTDASNASNLTQADDDLTITFLYESTTC